jgi:diguanylate cyclase (GGDEF)-like protein
MTQTFKTEINRLTASEPRGSNTSLELHQGLKALFHTTEELQFSKPLPTLLKTILRGLKSGTGLGRALIFTYDEGAERLQGISGLGLSEKKMESFSLSLLPSEEHQLLQLDLFSPYPTPSGAQTRLVTLIEENLGWKNVSLVPLEIRDRLVGTLAFESSVQASELREIVILFARQASYVIENARLFQQVEAMALRDTLTGLYNRRYLHQILDYEINRARRCRQPLSVVFIDLDHFKQINDTHGHAMGDKILRQVALRLSELFRTTDVLGRYAGDEFLAVLPSTPPSGVMILSERIINALKDYEMMVRGQGVRASVSIGFDTFHGEEGVGAATLIDRADQAMYSAKADGRGRVHAFSDGSQTAV